MDRSGRVAGKVALITGAGSGIGRATARCLAREGAKVAVTDIDGRSAAKTAEEIIAEGHTALSFPLNVTLESEWEGCIDTVLSYWEKLDILVNNAGISFAKPIPEMSLSEWRKVMSVNLDGAFLGTKYGIIAMRRGKGGSIINVSSASGIKASPGASAYSTSKAAVCMLSKSAALECAQNNDNIRVNSVIPSGVVTPMWSSMEGWEDLKAQAGGEEKLWEQLSRDIPLKRFAEPEEIAIAILYLASDESRFVTGSQLAIDGGFTI